MFSEKQVEHLSAKLDASHVKTRSQAGRQLSYVEGWHAIAEANRIFGFGAWDRETIEVKELGAPREVDGKWRVAYMARVRITVHTPDGDHPIINQSGRVIRDGSGYGSGIDRDLGSAHESAIKEAETDAMKRALMTFGNPFGLALYDKTQENVESNSAPQQGRNAPASSNRTSGDAGAPSLSAAAKTFMGAAALCQTKEAVTAWVFANTAEIDAKMTPYEATSIKQHARELYSRLPAAKLEAAE